MQPASEGLEPFAAHRCAARVANLRERLAAGYDGAPLLIGDPRNIRYLTGFDGSHGAVLVDADQVVLLTDSRYLLQAAVQSPGVEVVAARDVLAAGLDRGAVLLEGHHVTAAQWERLHGEFPNAALAPDLVGGLRQSKDDSELAALETACDVSERALREMLRTPVLGRTERELARELEWLLADGAGEGPAFESIVAGGAYSAEPHHRPVDRRLERGDLLKIDFGARVAGYCADITRTFVVAAEPAPWQRQIHGAVLAAQTAGRMAAAAGRPVAEVDDAARSVISAAGLGSQFGHGLGHGVGLAVHESPLIAATSAGTLARGMVVTIEPGVYLPDRGGVRIEDTVEVRDDGCRSLVSLSRELVTVA